MNKLKYEEIRFKSMGTNIHIKILHEKADSILKECESLLEEWAYQYSIFEPDSLISKVNKLKVNEEFELPDDMYDLLSKGLEYSKILPSINICMGRLIKLWDIGPGYGNLPDKIQIDRLLLNAHPSHVILSPEKLTIKFTKENIMLDLGSLAKGYFSDKLAAFLKNNKVHSALINLGGNIQTIGLNLESPSLDWSLNLYNPLSPDKAEISLAINDLSISTSAINYRNFTHKDKFYHHILDPKSGYPVETDMVSLSILGPDPVKCEALSTGLFGLNWQDIQDYINIEKSYEAISLYKDGQYKWTRGTDKYILWKK